MSKKKITNNKILIGKKYHFYNLTNERIKETHNLDNIKKYFLNKNQINPSKGN